MAKIVNMLEFNAQNGDAESQLRWGDRLLCRAEDPDPEKAVEWYRKSADQGHPEAFGRLADCYAAGRGIHQNVELAFDYATKGAEKGDSHCMFFIGEFYFYGILVEKNRRKAKEWYRKAANKFDFDATEKLIEWTDKED
ncbi:sel1 repeat family protein [bacterium]|nr:sel1 repeat family protein [bacterium]MBR5901882.1 sel1 repeat family protein [bacterium]